MNGIPIMRDEAYSRMSGRGRNPVIPCAATAGLTGH